MPVIRNSNLIKRFTDYFKLKVGDFLDAEAGRMLVPVVNLPLPLNIRVISDISLNDSDKTITVPAGKQWKIHSIFVSYVATAVAGNRRLRIRISNDSNNDVWDLIALNVQIANTTEFYMFQAGGVSVTEDSAARHIIPIPKDTILPEDFRIRINDQNAVDAAADDMVIRILIDETDITGE